MIRTIWDRINKRTRAMSVFLKLFNMTFTFFACHTFPSPIADEFSIICISYVYSYFLKISHLINRVRNKERKFDLKGKNLLQHWGTNSVSWTNYTIKVLQLLNTGLNISWESVFNIKFYSSISLYISFQVHEAISLTIKHNEIPLSFTCISLKKRVNVFVVV